MDKEFGFTDICDLDKKESADHIVGVVGEETVLIPADKLSGEKDWNVNDPNDPAFIKNKPKIPLKEENVYVLSVLGSQDMYNPTVRADGKAYIQCNEFPFIEPYEEYTVVLKGKATKSFECVCQPSYTQGISSLPFLTLKTASTYDDMCEFYITSLGYVVMWHSLFEELKRPNGAEINANGLTIQICKNESIGTRLVKQDGTPLDKSFAIDSEKYRYGDNLLEAVAGNRIPLVKVPNVGNNDLYDNYVLPWQIQVPKNGNDYVNVFYTKDGFAQKLALLLIEIFTTQNFTNLEAKFGELFGEMELQLHTPCEKAPIDCEEPLD